MQWEITSNLELVGEKLVINGVGEFQPSRVYFIQQQEMDCPASYITSALLHVARVLSIFIFSLILYMYYPSSFPFALSYTLWRRRKIKESIEEKAGRWLLSWMTAELLLLLLLYWMPKKRGASFRMLKHPHKMDELSFLLFFLVLEKEEKKIRH